MLNKMKIFSKINRPVILGSVVIFALFFLGLTQVYSESACSNQLSGINRYKSCQVDTGDTLVVNAEGCTYTCYKIVNSTAKNLFIPTNTCLEWDTFLAHLPAGITTATCIAVPTISVSNTTKTYGDPSFTITHSTNSDGAKTFSSSNTNVATITDAGVVTIVGVGTTTITFNTAATATYSAGTATATLTVNPITSTCTVTATNKTYGDSPFTIIHSTNSDGEQSFSSSNTNVATITDAGVVTIVSAGTATITMNVAATASHGATSCSNTLTIAKATPTCSVTATNKTFGDVDFTIGHSTNSTGTKTFSSSNTNVATVTSTGFVTIVSAGTTTITMNVAATTNYNATSCSNTLVVAGVTPTCSVTETIKEVDDGTFIIGQETNSDGAKTFSSSNTNVATITDAGVVTIVSVGTTTITMNVAATPNYSATSCSGALTITGATPTCSVSPVARTYGFGSYTVSSSTNSTGTKSFSSDNPTVATIDPTTGLITIGNAGTATITMHVAATDDYSATSCTGIQTVNKASQAAPPAPTCDSNTTTSITISACEGCEYRTGTGSAQSSPTFSGLYPTTSYTFSRRHEETQNYLASAWSPDVTCWTVSEACGGLTTATLYDVSYPIVAVGTQCWLAKNLNYATGSSWCYNNNTTNCDTYGRLYNWNTANIACPAGWHLPSDGDFTTLTNFTGASKEALYSAGWFDNIFAGDRNINGAFYNIGSTTYFWSSSAYDSASAWFRRLYASNSTVSRGDYSKANGFSVRCLRD